MFIRIKCVYENFLPKKFQVFSVFTYVIKDLKVLRTEWCLVLRTSENMFLKKANEALKERSHTSRLKNESPSHWKKKSVKKEEWLGIRGEKLYRTKEIYTHIIDHKP